ncbi:glycosyltransferase [Leifsonia sp. McL0607]|uniref:glycosyltransferase n=1 Tax=Leifsonia sp. McL0607 TaxID=3415672 RepID=UPI003CE6734E
MDDRAALAAPPLAGVSVVVPTFNEAGSIAELLHRLSLLLDPEYSEVLVVDDSTDDTVREATAEAHRLPHVIRIIHRSHPDGGLSGAVITGMRLAARHWVVVMDGDLQHPPEAVARLVITGRERNAGVVLGSRYCEGGHSSGLDGRFRHAVSSASTVAARMLFPRRLHGCSDPMSGFFAVRVDELDLDALHPMGFKILLEVLVRNRLTLVEVPYDFGARHGGVSKASLANGTAYLRQLVSLRFRHDTR